MVDTELVIKQYLNEASAFKTIIGSHLYIDRMLNFNGGTTAGCRFSIRAGTTERKLPITSPLVDFFLYGGTKNFYDCKVLYRALHDRLHAAQNKKVSAGVIIQAHEIVSGQNIVEPDTDWLLTLTTYQFDIREN